MLTQREILSTLEMLKNENLDVRTVTLGINLLDCASHDLEKLKNRTIPVSPILPATWLPPAIISVKNTAFQWSIKE